MRDASGAPHQAISWKRGQTSVVAEASRRVVGEASRRSRTCRVVAEACGRVLVVLSLACARARKLSKVVEFRIIVVRLSCRFIAKLVPFASIVGLLWTLLEMSETAVSTGLLSGDSLYRRC